MSEIDFKQRINSKRPYSTSTGDLINAVESDRGRIINSAAIRRLQQKTQVFPLERNAAVRSRLTHSLEVQQVGRFITQKVFEQLLFKQQGKQQCLNDLGLDRELEKATESLVEMACLMHDIGNPPFGHFGEKAINDWFSKHIDALLAVETEDLELLAKIRQDLQQFEGNAQAIRLVFSLLKLNLTYSQTATILKYTRPAYQPKPDKHSDRSYLMKKPGYYLSEERAIAELRKALEMEYGCRHPLSYIMEAADDISYCYADIEDAVEKGILTVPALKDLLLEAFAQQGGDPAQQLFKIYGESYSLTQLLHRAEKKAALEDIDKNNRFFVSLRVDLQHILTTHASYRFARNLDTIFAGTFNQALLEDKGPGHMLTEAFKSVAFEHVFSHPEVELQELRGYEIIHGLLDYYRPLLELSEQEFTGILDGERKYMQELSRESRLVKKLPGKHCLAYKKAVADYVGQSSYLLWERYFRCRLMLDFISGMTDQFAFDEYKSLTLRD